MNTPRHRLASDARLEANAHIELADNQAHYLTHVLRLRVGDSIALFNGTQGEWLAELGDIRKKHVTFVVKEKRRDPILSPDCMVCFAPIKAGRVDTILEKATELGARVIQPVITKRTIVDKFNRERAETIVREAAEQCERTDWPEIREAVKLPNLLGDWDATRTLFYGDESGSSEHWNNPQPKPSWAILTGPEGGFAPDELAMLRKVKSAVGVSLGPRILRADTAVITLTALTMSAWGDWKFRPHFLGEAE